MARAVASVSLPANSGSHTCTPRIWSRVSPCSSPHAIASRNTSSALGGPSVSTMTSPPCSRTSSTASDTARRQYAFISRSSPSRTSRPSAPRLIASNCGICFTSAAMRMCSEAKRCRRRARRARRAARRSARGNGARSTQVDARRAHAGELPDDLAGPVGIAQRIEWSFGLQQHLDRLPAVLPRTGLVGAPQHRLDLRDVEAERRPTVGELHGPPQRPGRAAADPQGHVGLHAARVDDHVAVAEARPVVFGLVAGEARADRDQRLVGDGAPLAKSAPTSSNSGSSEPTPTPRIRRPPLTTSSVP